jgi:tRNA (cytidine56-2'-O)-methyltransferase
MANFKKSRHTRGLTMPKIVVLRWGHRPHRDARVTTHVALAARALGASGLMLTDIEDKTIKETIEKVKNEWGGSFSFQMGNHWKKAIRDWKKNDGIVVHLTVYGENIETSHVLDRIKALGKDILLVVGSQKVPNEFFSDKVSDFNVAIGNQPHSECASIAVFLDRFFDGKELAKRFSNAKIRIIPAERGKNVVTMKKRDLV